MVGIILFLNFFVMSRLQIYVLNIFKIIIMLLRNNGNRPIAIMISAIETKMALC